MATLPFGAMAEGQIGPDGNLEYGQAVRASQDPYYDVATIGEYDDQHIATTAYVKGAYNDTIAAINTLNGIVEKKYDDLIDAAGFIAEEVVSNQRVRIYTTWDDDTAAATTQVELSTIE